MIHTVSPMNDFILVQVFWDTEEGSGKEINEVEEGKNRKTRITLCSMRKDNHSALPYDNVALQNAVDFELGVIVGLGGLVNPIDKDIRQTYYAVEEVVLFKKNAGKMFIVDNRKYILIQKDQIIAKINVPFEDIIVEHCVRR